MVAGQALISSFRSICLTWEHSTTTRVVKTLEACPEYDQKALEVCTPLVQNGADEHGPDRGDITAEWAHIGRLNGVRGKVDRGRASPHLSEA